MARDFDSLVSVLHADVLDAPSGKSPRQIAEDLGFRRYSTFMNQIEQQEGFKLDANLVLPLMRQTGSKQPLHYLADRLGCVVLDLPHNVPSNLEALSMQAIAAAKEVGDVLGVYRDKAGDGDVSRQDKIDIRKEIYEALVALLSFARSLENA